MSHDRQAVAIVGCGIGLEHLAEGFLALPELYEVRVLCDTDEVRLASAAASFGIARTTTSFDEVLAMPDIDIIDICTPPWMHFDQTVRALRAGKHVICEKPQVASLSELDRLEKVVTETGLSYLPIFQYRFDAGVQKAHHLIRSGLCGKLYLASAETFWTRDQSYYQSPWRGRWKGELGGVLMTHAIHIHDMLFHLIGQPAKLFSRIDTRVNPIEVEDCAAICAQMPDGALVSTSATLGSHRQISRLRLMFENVTMESSHEPYAPGRDPWAFTPVSEAMGRDINEALADFSPVSGRFRAIFTGFAQALRTGVAPPTTLEDVRNAVTLATAIYRSARLGADVALPLQKGDDYEGWITPLEMQAPVAD